MKGVNKMIGDGPDIEQFDRTREAEQKLMDEVYDWWDSLTEEEQLKVLLDWYPMEITKDTDIDKFFGDMGSERQLHIYKEENGYGEGIQV